MRNTVIEVKDAQAREGCGNARPNYIRGRRSEVLRQRLLPQFDKLQLFCCHLRLGGFISAGRRRLEMANHGARLVNHLPPVVPYSHAVVGVLVVRWSKLFLESTQFEEQRPRRKEKSSRTVIHRPAKLVCRKRRIIGTSVTQS